MLLVQGGVRARLRQMRCAGSQVTGMANQIVADGFAVELHSHIHVLRMLCLSPAWVDSIEFVSWKLLCCTVEYWSHNLDEGVMWHSRSAFI
jgi:hypothetical protein